jgi:integrase
VALFKRLKEMGGRAEVVLPMRDALTEPIGAAALNQAMARVKWGFPHFTPHDLRRTASTHLNEQGYNADWIEKALNHTPLGVRGTYNRAQFGEERRRMLQEWADYLEGLKDA